MKFIKKLNGENKEAEAKYFPQISPNKMEGFPRDIHNKGNKQSFLNLSSLKIENKIGLECLKIHYSVKIMLNFSANLILKKPYHLN